jgi:hypothetical protein
MGWSSSRRATTILGVISAVGIALAAVGACTLYSTGLGEVPGDAATTVPIDDATASEPPVEIPDARQSAADADGTAPGVPDGCAPIETDCLDGIDNDCNGLTDCADPACTQGYQCVPSAPSGWTGYALYDDSRAVPCPASYGAQLDTYEGLIFSPATCSACQCTATGATCGTSAVACGPTCGATDDSLAPGCEALAVAIEVDAGGSCSASAPAAIPGTCASAGGAATITDVTFAKLSRTCGATGGAGGGCASAQACVAKPPAGTHGACVSQTTSGSTLCPSAYPHAYVVLPSATSFADTRACTGCSCGGPSGASCAASVTLSPVAGCGSDDGGAPVTFPADGVCHGGLVDAGTTFVSGALEAGVASQGACVAEGGAPTGTVTPMNQTAYCCQD